MSGLPEKSPKFSIVPDVDTNGGVDSPPEKPMTETREQFVEKALAEFESPLIGYAVTILHDLDRARDVVQDTFIRLCQQEPNKIRESLKTWLFTVCRNRAFDVLRKEKRIQPLDEVRWKKVAGPDLSPDERAVRDERMGQVMQALDRLSANQREVILLKFQQGLSYQEIVEVTGLSSGNVGFLIHTGLKRLRDTLPNDFRS
jgi:RNA polymerase sigma factor (sigma-70 family)